MFYFTQQGLEKETRNHFWHHAAPRKVGTEWEAELRVLGVEQPLWAYANMLYPLPRSVDGAGFYYGLYTATNFSIASSLVMASPEALQAAKVTPTRKTSTLIESFQPGWETEWYTCNESGQWPWHTHKLNSEEFQAPPKASLAVEILSPKPNQLVLQLDDAAAQVQIQGGTQWQKIVLSPADFHNAAGDALSGWKKFGELILADTVTLELTQDGKKQTLPLGAPWQGPAPRFRNLHWQNTAPGQ